jgi:hypothetical protein
MVAGMPKPLTPPDLKHCSDCGKVIGPHKGWFGPECQCALPRRMPYAGLMARGRCEAANPHTQTPLSKLRLSSFLAIKSLGIG